MACPERNGVNDDPTLMQHQQHADDDRYRARTECEADQDCAGELAHHARFFAIFFTSRPCGRKINTMISKVNAIRSRS